MERDDLARKLRELRTGAGLSQQSLGQRLGRPQSYVSKIENAERRVELHEVEEWASALGKSMYWTFVDKEGAGRAREGNGRDADLVAGIAWLLPRLGASERALLQHTVSYLRERIEGGGR